MQAIASLRQEARYNTGVWEKGYLGSLGIGAVVGVGALIYGFLRIGQLVDEPALIAEAHALSSLITPEKIGGDRWLDVVLGSAGTILALLALDRTAPDPNRNGHTALDLAVLCGRHLVRRRVSEKGEPRAWITFPGLSARSGLSHGAAGVSLALTRLHERTGEREFWRAAWEGLEFEAGLYSPEHRNWYTSSRDGTEPLTRWCFGAPGIVLARLGMLNASPDAAERTRLLAETRIALATTQSAPRSEVDHICCGNMGRVEILLAAGQRLRDDSLTESAHALTASTLDSAEARGSFAGDAGSRFDLSLFRGNAGVGYTLLRLLKPETLPCVLALE